MALPAVKTDAWYGCPEYKGKPGTALTDSRLLAVRRDAPKEPPTCLAIREIRDIPFLRLLT